MGYCGLLPQWEKLPVSQESPLESVLETSRPAALFPLWPLPYRQHSKEGYPAQVNTEGPAPLQLIRGPKQRNMVQMKEQSKASERELSEEEIANLSDGEFKALVVEMLTDLIELGRKVKKKNKHPTTT